MFTWICIVEQKSTADVFDAVLLETLKAKYAELYPRIRRMYEAGSFGRDSAPPVPTTK